MIVILTCIVHIAPACVCVCMFGYQYGILDWNTCLWPAGIHNDFKRYSFNAQAKNQAVRKVSCRLFLPDAVCPRIAAVDKSQCNRQHRAYMTLWTLELNINLNEVDIKRKPTALLNRQVKHFRPTAHHDAGVEIVHKICHNSCRPQHLAAHAQKSLFWLEIWQVPSNSKAWDQKNWELACCFSSSWTGRIGWLFGRPRNLKRTSLVCWLL